MTTNNISITIQTTINAPVEKVWAIWNTPEHIIKWNTASDDWHTPRAENDLQVGGKFLAHMAAKDGSMAFDFVGIYDVVVINKSIAYTMEDGRKVNIAFISENNTTTIVETFDAESENTPELQRAGWQAILDNFKHYTESLQ